MLKKCWYNFILLTLFSCSSESISPDPERVGFTYFPLEVGMFQIYQVSDIINNGFGLSIDSSYYQLKVLVAGSFLNSTGDSSYVIERLRRETPTNPWVLDSVWHARRNQNQAVSVENNIPFIKLVFPLEEGRKWDGNALNSLDCPNTILCDEYEMINIRQNLQIDTSFFENTVTVIQEENIDQLSITSDDVRTEVYANGIGLVYKEIRQVIYLQCNNGLNPSCCCPDPGQLCTICSGTIDQGRRLKQVLIEYGLE